MAPITEEVRRTLATVRDRVDAALDRLRPDDDNNESDMQPQVVARRNFTGPDVDIEETADAIIIRAELPGLKPEEFTIEAAKNRVILRGTKDEEHEESGQGFQRMERRYGSFVRAFQLPAEVDPDAATAAYREGVLHLVLPKTEQSKARRIHIDVART